MLCLQATWEASGLRGCGNLCGDRAYSCPGRRSCTSKPLPQRPSVHGQAPSGAGKRPPTAGPARPAPPRAGPADPSHGAWTASESARPALPAEPPLLLPVIRPPPPVPPSLWGAGRRGLGPQAAARGSGLSHVERVKKPTAMRDSHENRFSHGRGFFDSRGVRNVWHKSGTLRPLLPGGPLKTA